MDGLPAVRLHRARWRRHGREGGGGRGGAGARRSRPLRSGQGAGTARARTGTASRARARGGMKPLGDGGSPSSPSFHGGHHGSRTPDLPSDRKRDGKGKSVSVRVDLGGT